MTIRLSKHIDSETLHLPELRSLIGQDVEIIVIGSNGRQSSQFWQAPDLDTLATQQGLADASIMGAPLSKWEADAFDGLDEAREQWRIEEKQAARQG
jgi:hypothetical protein